MGLSINFIFEVCNAKLYRCLSKILYLGITGWLLCGCTDDLLLLTDKGKLSVYTAVPSAKESQMSQIKHLSRDLEHCQIRHQRPSLSEEDLRRLSQNKYRDVILQFQTENHPCLGSLTFLVKNIGLARDENISKRKIYNLLIEGQILPYLAE